MKVDNPGDDRPTFEELLNEQVSPLLQADAFQKKVLGEAELIASDTDDAISQANKGQRIRDFLEARTIVTGILHRFDVENKLKSIKRSVWKRGSKVHFFDIEDGILRHDYTEPFRSYISPYPMGDRNRYVHFATGFRLFYETPAVVEADGADLIKVHSPFIYDEQKYLPIAEAQIIEVRVVDTSGLEVGISQPTEYSPKYKLIVDSRSQLNIPTRFEMGNDWLILFGHVSRSTMFGDRISDIAGSAFAIEPLIHKLRETSSRVFPESAKSKTSFDLGIHEPEYDRHTSYLELDPDADVSVFDELLAQDCRERILRRSTYKLFRIRPGCGCKCF